MEFIALFLLILALIFGVIIWSTVWAYKDAHKRGQSAIIVALLIFVSWPIGLVIWLVARPENSELKRLAEKFGN